MGADRRTIARHRPSPTTEIDAVTDALRTALSALEQRPAILVASYFGTLGGTGRPCCDRHRRLCESTLWRARNRYHRRNPGPARKHVVAGVVDGRNIWRTDLDYGTGHSRNAARQHRLPCGVHFVLAAARSVLARRRTGYRPTLRSWLALRHRESARGSDSGRRTGRSGRESVEADLRNRARRRETRRSDSRLHNHAVRAGWTRS